MHGGNTVGQPSVQPFIHHTHQKTAHSKEQTKPSFTSLLFLLQKKAAPLAHGNSKRASQIIHYYPSPMVYGWSIIAENTRRRKP
jgi:hypothetical protein